MTAMERVLAIREGRAQQYDFDHLPVECARGPKPGQKRVKESGRMPEAVIVQRESH